MPQQPKLPEDITDAIAALCRLRAEALADDALEPIVKLLRLGEIEQPISLARELLIALYQGQEKRAMDDKLRAFLASEAATKKPAPIVHHTYLVADLLSKEPDTQQVTITNPVIDHKKLGAKKVKGVVLGSATTSVTPRQLEVMHNIGLQVTKENGDDHPLVNTYVVADKAKPRGVDKNSFRGVIASMVRKGVIHSAKEGGKLRICLTHTGAKTLEAKNGNP